jgi:hypothetical protein
MTEEELHRRRQEFRDQEVMTKIADYQSTSAVEFRQQTLKSNYTYRKVEKTFGKIGWSLIIVQAIFLVLFSFLFIFSYIPKTKFLVSMVMP